MDARLKVSVPYLAFSPPWPDHDGNDDGDDDLIGTKGLFIARAMAGP